MKRKKSKLNSIISEIAYDLGVDKKTVRKVVNKINIRFFPALEEPISSPNGVGWIIPWMYSMFE